MQASADWYEGSTSHLQKLRNAVAYQYISQLATFLQNLPHAQHATLLMSIDESEQLLNVGGDSGIYSFMMCHFSLYWTLADNTTRVYELPTPPAVLDRTTAPNLLTALLKLLPMSLRLIKQRVSTLGIVPVSDSAPACLRVGRHFKACTSLQRVLFGGRLLLDGVIAVHSTCRMHQVSIICGAVLKGLQVLNPMFCSCVLMQRGTVRRNVKAQCKMLLDRTLKVQYSGDAVPEQHAYLVSLFQELDWADEETEEMLYAARAFADDPELSKRREAHGHKGR
jgi:predicted secreted protein